MPYFNLKPLVLFLSFITILLCTTTCRSLNKEGLVIVTVYDKVTNVPVSGIEVRLLQLSISSGGGGQVASYTTNNEGKVRFEYKDKDGYSYQVYASGTNYTFGSEKKAVSIGRNKLILYPYPDGWVKAHIKNVNPYDQLDYITFGSQKEFYGDKVDTIVVVGPFRGGGYLS